MGLRWLREGTEMRENTWSCWMLAALLRKSPARSNGAQSVGVAALGYECVSESLMSASACLVAFLDSALESAVGRSVWIALPRLIDLLPVPAGQAETLVADWPVMSACM